MSTPRGKSGREFGIRVGAILGARDGIVDFLGFGVYEGDFPRPGAQREAIAYLPVVREMFAKDAARDDSDLRAMHASFAERAAPEHRLAPEEVEERIAAEMQRRRERGTWDDERILRYISDPGGMMDNPRILLDSGKHVWGMECWWGPADQVQAKLDAYRAQGQEIRVVDIDDARAGRV